MALAVGAVASPGEEVAMIDEDEMPVDCKGPGWQLASQVRLSIVIRIDNRWFIKNLLVAWNLLLVVTPEKRGRVFYCIKGKKKRCL